MATDQAHEQANTAVKARQGTMASLALRRWIIAGPEVSRLVLQYDSATSKV